MNERTGWDRRLSVTADGKGLVGHAGAVLLHKLADRVGLTQALGRLWPDGQSATWRNRAHVLVALAAAIAYGARSLLEAERLQTHQAALFGAAPSDSTTHRALAGLDEAMLARIAKMRAQVRRRLWRLLHL
ncbi:IS1380 family transposase, partial [Nonomuraea sp. NPDC049709]